MKKLVLATLAALTVAGSTAVYAQQRSWGDRPSRVSMEDRAALTDARIAAVKAGLKLTADQEKLWPPLETAVRDFTKLEADRANARRQARQGGEAQAARPDPVARLSARADSMAATAAALKKIADAAEPLYKTLDDGQKHRLALLTRIERGMSREGWRDRRHHERRFRHERRDRRGGDRDGDSGRL